MFVEITLTFLLILSFKTTVDAQSPKVYITKTNPPTINDDIIIIERDTDLVMDCFVDNLVPGMNVKWQVEYTDRVDGLFKVKLISNDMALEDNIHYGLERPSQYTWSLRVRGTQQTDEGVYKCFVQLTQNSVSHESRTVYTIVEPYFKPQYLSPDVYANEGDDLSLLCNASGSPIPSVLWSRVGGQVLSVGQEIYEGVRLQLKNVQASDRGIYMCTAINEQGRASHRIIVSVNFKPIVKVARKVVKQAVGYRIELQCFIEANPNPEPELSHWVKGTRTYTMSSDRYVVKWIEGAFNRMVYELIIKDVQPEDYGTFTCKVSNDEVEKTMASASIELQETDIPQNSLKLGRPVRGDENPVAGRGFSNSPKLFIVILFLILNLLSKNIL